MAGWAGAWCFLATYFAVINGTSAIPTLAFPFNSQVPTVARVNQAYSFQISDSTFAPEDTAFVYSLSSQPAWLSIDSVSRTLSGTPSQGDVGAATFTLTAADSDGAAHATCTLVVSAEPAPRLMGDISDQLAATANLSSTQPPTVTLLPSTSFQLNFQRSSFIDIVQRKLYFYATMADHAPLPAWLLFDADSLSFSGMAPVLSAFPQSWAIDLIASDVEGFAGATANFTIAVGTQQLAFVPVQQTVKITPGESWDFTALAGELYRDGVPVQVSTLASAQASSLPKWASFNATTLAITGTPPVGISNDSISITVSDQSGASATAIINIASVNNTLLVGSIGTLTAYAGEHFSYQFPKSLFSSQDPTLSITLPATATWLSFDAANRTLQGTAPSTASPTIIVATLAARTSQLAPAETQTFTIDVQAQVRSPTIGASRVPTASSRATASATPFAAPVAEAASHPHLTGGIIAAIVVLSVVIAALLPLLLILCLRRRNRDGYGRQNGTPVRRKVISRPLTSGEDEGIIVTTGLQRDVEKAADTHEAPPQIALTLPSTTMSKGYNWKKRFSRLSQVSSIGVGEDAIRRDENIPEWGGQTAALHTPHDSFSVPNEMARVSRQLSQASPTKRAMRRLRERRQSRHSIGLGINTGTESVFPRHRSKKSRGHGQGGSSVGLAIAGDRSSQASITTRGTSVLSTQASDFPRPPGGSSRHTLSRYVPTLSITDAERHQSIRLVNRSDSIADNRSVAEKRQSFLRNRASTGLQSPLFSHGSRASSKSGQNARDSRAALSTGSVRRSRNAKCILASYSESSSLEPHREAKRLSARVRSAFPPNYPRAITRSSLGADDEGVGDGDSSEYSTTDPSIREEDTRDEANREDIRAQIQLPRQERSWVFPGEASPTPPPAPPASRQPSTGRRSSSCLYSGEAPWQQVGGRARDRSSSPLASSLVVADRSSVRPEVSRSNRRSRLSEPMSLVSNDSVSRAKLERPKLGHSASQRPVSVAEVKRLSSMKAESGTEPDAVAGGGMGQAEGSGIVLSTVGDAAGGTQRSNASGPAFL